MSYEPEIVEALGVAAPPGSPPTTVQCAWTRLHESLTYGMAAKARRFPPEHGKHESLVWSEVLARFSLCENLCGTSGSMAQASWPLTFGARWRTEVLDYIFVLSPISRHEP